VKKLDRHRVNLIAFLLSLASGLACSGQEAPQPFLWRIAGGKPSYLFGTIHLSGQRETTLAPAVEEAIDACDALYCEIPMNKGSQMKAASEMMAGGKSLKEALPNDLYERANAQLKLINPALSLATLDKAPVWALGAMLPMIEEQLKNPGAQALDARLYARAEAAQKEVGGIETLAEQFGALSGFTPDEQLAMLRDTLDEMEKARRENRSPVGKLRDAYLSGSLDRLDAEMAEWMDGFDPALKKKVLATLITERNLLMADRMAEKLKTGKSYFFAVGAGHLNGEEGLLRLLEKQGFMLERVK